MDVQAARLLSRLKPTHAARHGRELLLRTDLGFSKLPTELLLQKVEELRGLVFFERNKLGRTKENGLLLPLVVGEIQSYTKSPVIVVGQRKVPRD